MFQEDQNAGGDAPAEEPVAAPAGGDESSAPAEGSESGEAAAPAEGGEGGDNA